MSSKGEAFDANKCKKDIQEAKSLSELLDITKGIENFNDVNYSVKGVLYLEANKRIKEILNFEEYYKETLEKIEKANTESEILSISGELNNLSKFQEELYKLNDTMGRTYKDEDMNSLISEIQMVTEMSSKAKERLAEIPKETKQDEEQDFSTSERSEEDGTVSFKTAEDYVKEEQENKIEELKAKVANLCEKILNEPNRFKKQMYRQRFDRLCEKIDSEIAIRKIKEEYDEKIGDLDSKKEDALNEKIQNTITNNANIDFSEASIAEKRKYDYDSPKFMFDRNEVIKKGGLDSFIEYLEESGNPDFIIAAKKIKEVEIEKINLEGYYEAEELNKSRNIEREHKKAVKEVKKEENKLIKKEKGNIFSRIGNFFKSIGQGIKNYFDEKKAEKAEVSKFYEQRVQKEAEDIKAKYRVKIDSWEVANQSEKGQDAQEQGDDEKEQ